MTEPTFLRTTRAACDSIAADYAARFRGEVAGKPLDRALFSAFAELVQAAGAEPYEGLENDQRAYLLAANRPPS